MEKLNNKRFKSSTFINGEENRKYYIETFGCQMNEFDSERVSYCLEGLKYSRTYDAKLADIIVLNTCAVREKAKNRLYGHIGSLKRIKIENPDVLICIGGCVAQNLKEKILDDFPYVDIVFGTQNIEKLPELINQRLNFKKSICNTFENSDSLEKLYFFKRDLKFKAFLPVMIGCNNFCSYCIVPYVRGRERSIKPHQIISTIKRLVDDGVIEVTLLGQNVNSYGKDLNLSEERKHYNFAELLSNVSAVKGLRRIRFMTSHPKDFNEDIVSVIKENSNIMKHIHLPLQAGSNKILKLMNRKYTRETFTEKYNYIKNQIPDCTVTTDIIVGFPGEEERDFYETLDMVNSLRFHRAFTFIYSKRHGAAAAKLDDFVPKEEKKLWFRKLVDLQNKISYEENLKLLGKKLEVLVEGYSMKNLGQFVGRLENNTIVNFDGFKKDANLTGRLVNVEIKDAKVFYLIGKLEK